ncbi:MAG: tetratricopeptide repeat protein [Sedimentisphaerales bacterium]|nr:tetratricopeptide repeat protein [Sedimentisphaerales bacterium]
MITKECLSCGNKFDALLSVCSNCGVDIVGITEVGDELVDIIKAQTQSVKHNDNAIELFKQGKIEEALDEIKLSIKINPKHSTAYSNFGYMLLELGETDEAVDNLLKALELNPHHKDAPNYLYNSLS